MLMQDKNSDIYHSFLSNSWLVTLLATLIMPYNMLPVTPADLPDIIPVYQAAFKDDPFIGQLMPNVLPEVKQAYDMHYWENQLRMSEYNGMRFRKLVDEDGYDRCRLRIAGLDCALICGLESR